MRRKEIFILIQSYLIWMYNYYCRDTVCSPNLKELGYELNEPNTINLLRMGERTGLLAN